ncbi:WD repeat-containing protein 36 [Dissostichus eleginoides]|uniref:WD repeat-containing protein 36 n=1 Tax=Dissostichus eleginoides TaxID=100907 RepID=A0AAD9BKH4_DISEL|nr:WD repeat-containing protein 36 [Dissostichus eleginoides]
MMHPSTYLNKVLLGSSQGALQLWNIKTSKLLFTFPGWSAGVTVLQQSPAVDVVGVGTATGRIIIHNIRLDETLMSFTQDWGPISSLAFRTDGPPILASGSPQGHIAFWDLERRHLVTQQRHAHNTAIAAATFLHGEPLLITNGADNAIKVVNLKVVNLKVVNLKVVNLKVVNLKVINLKVVNLKVVNLKVVSVKVINLKVVNLKVVNLKAVNLKVWIFDQEGGGARLLRCRQGHSAPPTTIRHHGNDGKNILSAGQDGTLQSFSTVHERFNKSLGHAPASPRHHWTVLCCCSSVGLGRHRGVSPRSPSNHHLELPAAVDITSCGNFAVIGSSSGRVDVYNLQSGLHRGGLGAERAHSGAVRGVATETLNQMTFTAGSDWLLKFWRFKTRKQEGELKLPAAPASMMLHRDSGMLALALDDFTLLVVDIETRRVVRKFAGHQGNINDMTFSPDGRWLVTVAMDCTIRTWDLPSGSLVDCFLVAMAPTSVSLSPTGDFLVTTHVDSLGVYLWTNKSLCGPVGLRPLPADFLPTEETLPGVMADASEQEVTSEDFDDAYESADQLGAELVTLSLLPESRWKSLMHLDTIKRSEFLSDLQAALQTSCFDRPLSLLKDCGPAAVSVEITCLTSLGGGATSPGGGASLLPAFIQMIDSMLASGRDFDLAQGYLALFLKVHLRSLSQDSVAMAALLGLSNRLEAGWAELRTSFDQSMCLLSYAKSALL